MTQQYTHKLHTLRKEKITSDKNKSIVNYLKFTWIFFFKQSFFFSLYFYFYQQIENNLKKNYLKKITR